MKFECDSCHAQYMIADDKLGTRGVKVKCKRCSHVIIVRPVKKDDLDDAPTATSTRAPDTFVERDSHATAPDGAGDAPDDEELSANFDSEDEPTRATFDAPTEVAGSLGDDTIAGDPPPPPAAAAESTVVGPAPQPSADDDAAEDENPFLKQAGAPDGDDPFRGLGDLDDDDEDETRADAGAPFGAGHDDDHHHGGSDGDAGRGGADDGSLRMDSELDANPFFGDGAGQGSDEPALDAGLDVPAPPPPDTVPSLADGASGGGMPAVGDGDDLLEGELAGAFGAMFADVDEGGAERGPTQVLDLGRVDQLRAESLRSEVQGGGGLDELRSGLDATFDGAFGGLAPSARGAGDLGQTLEGPPEGSQASDDADDGEWHAAIDDEDVGPLTLKEVGEHIKSGGIDRETLVWRPGMDDWTPAGEVREVRPLFDAVPLPRIGSGEGAASFDVGSPIDDLGPSPFSSAEGAAEKDPFGPIPGFDTDDGEGAWQPHGLTEVYQAANLAEAAGGLGGAPAPAASGGVAALDDEEEVDWKPGAGSALASLVSSEIERLDSPRFGESSLPPAADDSLSLNLDAPLGAASSNGLGGLGSLDLPAEKDEEPLASPGFGGVPPMASPALSGGMPPQASLAGMPMAPYPGMPTSPLKNPLVLIAAVGGTVIVLLFVVVLLLVFRDPAAPVVAQQQPVPGAAVPATGQATAPAATAPPAEAVASSAAATPPSQDNKPEPAADAQVAAATPEPTPAEKAPEPAAEAPKPKQDKKPTRVASSQRKQPERKAQRRQQRRQQPKPRVQPVQRTRDCDPVLDLDCDEKPLASSSSRSQKSELTPSDVLSVIKRNLRSVNSCASKHGAKGTLKMEWRILRSGSTSSVRVATPSFAGTPVGDCVTSAIKRWKFPASNKPPREAIKFPFKLKG